ncbi:hypothetical protein QFZ89_004045 [Paraburkholderia youngii]
MLRQRRKVASTMRCDGQGRVYGCRERCRPPNWSPYSHAKLTVQSRRYRPTRYHRRYRSSGRSIINRRASRKVGTYRPTPRRQGPCTCQGAVAFVLDRTAGAGREFALPTGRFRDAEFHWPLSGDEFEERADAARPVAANPIECAHVGNGCNNGHWYGNQTFIASVISTVARSQGSPAKIARRQSSATWLYWAISILLAARAAERRTPSKIGKDRPGIRLIC